jgi:hypothetical protein
MFSVKSKLQFRSAYRRLNLKDLNHKFVERRFRFIVYLLQYYLRELKDNTKYSTVTLFFLKSV